VEQGTIVIDTARQQLVVSAVTQTALCIAWIDPQSGFVNALFTDDDGFNLMKWSQCMQYEE
jgi:hypothetical protein